MINSYLDTLSRGKINEGENGNAQHRDTRKIVLSMALKFKDTDSVDMSLSKVQELGKDKEVWHATVHGVTKSGTLFSE